MALAIRLALTFAATMVLAAGVPGAPAGQGARTSLTEDSYVLSRGTSGSTSSGSLETLLEVRHRYSGEFLWARRAGRQVIIRDPGILAEANSLFEPLRELAPERKALERRQRRLEKEGAALDAESEALDLELDRLSDDAEDEERSAEDLRRDELERRRRDLESRQRDLEGRERDLESVERSLDGREDDLEKRAEASLWKLIDGAISRGLAEDARQPEHPLIVPKPPAG